MSINKKKTYIGTYLTDTEAAIAFDFHSILEHSLSAKTNFSYTKQLLEEMVANFEEYNGVLKPIYFVDRL